ncbi:MAG: methionine--tRNA ligase [Chloroflexi bacterium]|nr:methionine--tRNA ligase [Chloroflexota bacterium]MBV9600564.1 methionine--tRNA ligase [Chloroflexota bacterium]
MESPYYLTTPIYYANDVPHIGHAYTTIAADAIARYQRLNGRDVFLLTGTDEHGVNIERVAASQGVSAREHVDRIARQFDALWSRLDISYDRFIRTTESAHHRAVLALWQRLQASGDLYRATYAGAYCARCEAYYQPDELDRGLCPVHALACDTVAEQNWFFRLSRYQDALERLVRDTDFVRPTSRRNEVLAVIRDGLRDFSVSRRQVRWGVPVPEGTDEVIYVWVDALANYLTGVGYPDDSATFERYWPADLHLVGKEIIRFHCLYWPALLLSAGLPLPRQVFAHGWLTKDGKKISKTTGNTIDPSALAAEFGSDAVRYYLLRATPFGQDGDYTRAGFLRLYNAELANAFGNLVQRATVLAHRHAGALSAEGAACGPELELCAEAEKLDSRVTAAFETLALHEAVAAVGEFVTAANRYLQVTAPWQLAGTGDARRLGVVLRHTLQAARLAARWYAPIIPRAAAEASRRLGVTRVEVGPPLFPRYSC